MLDNNSTTHVFKFVQLRGAVSDDVPSAELSDSTNFAQLMLGAGSSDRFDASKKFLSKHGDRITQVIGSEPCIELLSTLQTAAKNGANFSKAKIASANQLKKLAQHEDFLSDVLLAAKFSRAPNFDVNGAAITFRAIRLRSDSRADDIGTDQLIKRPIRLPEKFAKPKRTSGDGPRSRSASTRRIEPGADRASGLPIDAMSELVSSLRPELIRTTSEVARGPLVSSLRFSSDAIARLSPATRAVLEDEGIDIAHASPFAAIERLERVAHVSPPAPVPVAVTTAPGSLQFGGAVVPGLITAAGIAELLVVKQHLFQYRPTDIAHVENVLAGETKSRTHRLLERSEQIYVTESETSKEKESELETAERFELKQEAEQTIKRDQQIGFGFSLSGKYGPAVEFSTNVNAQLNFSTEESTKSAVTYAKDVMERSLDKVTERVRQQQTLTLIREQEETNVHTLENPSATHRAGIYQFLEKDYESQVFNYGLRQIFDIMVPEPASYLWKLESSPSNNLSLPKQPESLSNYAADALAINSGNYADLAARFGASDVTPPPPWYKMMSVSLKGGAKDEDGQPTNTIEKEIPIPAGYMPMLAIVRPAALTDDDLTLAITIGPETAIWQPRGTDAIDAGGASISAEYIQFSMSGVVYNHDAQGRLPVQVISYETANFGVVVNALFLRSDETFKEWQFKTFAALVRATNAQQMAYEQKIEQLQAEAERNASRNVNAYGSPPAQNARTIRKELKKHCLSILTQQWFDDFNSTNDNDPPTFDLVDAASEGAFTRFFEQAFEWEQLQYVCYPYFWARKSTWPNRVRRQEVDPVFLDFLQAGSARVVIAVRPGFEAAVSHFLETGIIADGQPDVQSDLYLPIVTEIQERTGASQGEIAVGDPWITTLPTPLILVRTDNSLPKWARPDIAGWDWSEVP